MDTPAEADIPGAPAIRAAAVAIPAADSREAEVQAAIRGAAEAAGILAVVVAAIPAVVDVEGVRGAVEPFLMREQAPRNRILL